MMEQFTGITESEDGNAGNLDEFDGKIHGFPV